MGLKKTLYFYINYIWKRNKHRYNTHHSKCLSRKIIPSMFYPFLKRMSTILSVLGYILKLMMKGKSKNTTMSEQFQCIKICYYCRLMEVKYIAESNTQIAYHIYYYRSKFNVIYYISYSSHFNLLVIKLKCHLQLPDYFEII